MPSMDLFEQTGKLELLFQEYECMWSKAVFKVFWNDKEENWGFSVDYEYETK